jgi:putative ABC transport system permease protein
MSVTPFITGARRDIAYSLRLLRRTPGFAVVAIATLALGIGASTAIFTVVSSVLLRPLRFADPARLAMILTDNGARLSQAYLHDWRAESRTLKDIAGWYDARMNLTGGQTPLELRVDRVTANFFDVLGVPVSLGRSFTPATDLDHADPEIVLSDGFWQTHFGANRAVLGRVLVLDGQSYTVVGVMPT